MAGSAKNYDVTHIQQNPGDAWIIPSPGIVDSAAPQVGLFTDGTPLSTYTAVNLGTFAGATTILSKPKFDDIKVDQADTAVAKYCTANDMSVELDLMQLDPTILQNALPYGVFATQASPGYNQLTFGGIGVVTPLCLAFISPKRGAPGKFVVAILFNAVGTGGFSAAIGRAKPTAVKVKFDGLADLTRGAGRQTGVFYETL
jgi:hypothetical protein